MNRQTLTNRFPNLLDAEARAQWDRQQATALETRYRQTARGLSQLVDALKGAAEQPRPDMVRVNLGAIQHAGAVGLVECVADLEVRQAGIDKYGDRDSFRAQTSFLGRQVAIGGDFNLLGDPEVLGIVSAYMRYYGVDTAQVPPFVTDPLNGEAGYPRWNFVEPTREQLIFTDRLSWMTEEVGDSYTMICKAVVNPALNPQYGMYHGLTAPDLTR